VDLLDRVERWGRRAPDRPAHLSGGRRLCYGELVERSGALAAFLAASLPDRGAPVAVLGHKQPELLIAFLAAIRAGHAYVPIDDSLPSHRVRRILALAGAALVLTPDEIAARSAGAAAPADRCLGPHTPVYVMFTSGSTGEPKGVVITRGNLAHFLGWMLAEHRFAEGGEVFLNQAPFSFDLSVMDTYLSLLTGGTLVSLTRDEIGNPKRLYAALAGAGITTWVSTPSFARLCLAEPSFTAAMLPRLRRWLFCGETLAPEIAAALLDRFPQAEVWNTYGPTEATVACTSIRIDRAVLARHNPLPIGRPMPGTRLLAVDAAGQVVPDGARGELVIAGPNVSPGYLGRPDLTERAFATLDGAQAYRTGDWGRWQDGLLFWEGRLDDQVKVAGHRIELGDVEANLRALPGVRDAAALVLRRPGRPEALAAAVIPAGDDRPAERAALARALAERLAERLPAYMLPRKLVVLDAFPLTPNGKIDRRALAERLA
jgi:D-alanine--poly(phosphoribitol) ligase subunit 1